MKRFYRINQYIKAESVRVIDEKGKQLGVMPLPEALFKARQQGVDLVEVAEKAQPPVCKIIDFKKFRYQENKKFQASKKKAKREEVKEFRLTPFIAQNDFEIRLKRAKHELGSLNKVKLTVKFVGRQITRKEFGFDLLKKAEKALEGVGKVETPPRFMGKLLSMTLKPIKAKK